MDVNDSVIVTNPESRVTREDFCLRGAILVLDHAESDYVANVTNHPRSRGEKADAAAALH